MPDELRVPAARRFCEVERLIDRFLAEHGDPSARVSVWFGGLDGHPWFRRGDGKPHYAASTMKLPLVLAAYRRHDRHELDLDGDTAVRNRFSSALDGSPFSLDPADDQDPDTWAALDRTLPLRRLAEHALVRSGNLATNLLLEQVGADEVARVLHAAGCGGHTALPRGIEDGAAREAGLDNTVTALDLGRVLRGVANRTLASEPACIEVEHLLATQHHRRGIPAGLPPGTYVADKPGWVDGVAHDAALVRPEHRPPFVLVVCATVNVQEQEADRLIAGISRRLWEVYPA